MWSIRLRSEESFSPSCAGNDRSINAVHHSRRLSLILCASGSSVLASNISSLWPLQLVWINGLFGCFMSYVCIFLQVLSPRPVTADDAVLCSRRFESSAHYSGGVKAALSGRRRLRGTHTATGQSTNSIWACWHFMD